MNTNILFPYWALGKHDPYIFEMKPALRLESWQHPDQNGDIRRPNGHQVLSLLESKFRHRLIGLITLLYYQEHPDERPEIFRNIHMFGWLDVVHGPYAGRLFVPTLTPQGRIHWMDLNSCLNCLDFSPLRKLV
jgi:hypothetical protein